MGNKHQGGKEEQGGIDQAKINVLQPQPGGTLFQKPITFEEFGPSSQGRDSQKNKEVTKNTSNGSFNNQPNFTVGSSAMKCSRIVESEIDKNLLTVINSKGERISQASDKNQITVPFAVVKITIDSNVMSTIAQLKSDFLSKYQQKSKTLDNNWKINKKGNYYKELPKSRIVIIKQGLIYEGGFIQKGSDIFPHDFGTLFTDKAMYVGHFSSGQAHGKGVYTDRIEKSRFQGEWVNGEMLKGTINNPHYHFQGQFNANIAQGQGSITFRKQNCTYTGNFHEGLYEDQNGYFQSKEYDYSGGFKEGKKNGIGCLIQKQRYLQSKSKRYKPQQQFQGYFSKDVYKGKQKISEPIEKKENDIQQQ